MAETENFALEVIKRIHHELGTENSADKLKLVIKIIAEETRSASADIYVKADDVTLEHIAGFPQNGSRRRFVSAKVLSARPVRTTVLHL